MQKALQPRTADGYIDPMIVYSEPSPSGMIYPHFKVGDGPQEPMVFAADFKCGKIPSCLEYCPGHEQSGDTRFDGTNLDAIVYNDPVLNLPPYQQRFLQQAHLGEPRSNIPVSAPLPEKITPSASRGVISTASGLKLCAPGGNIPLSNFALQVVERRHLIACNEQTDEEIELAVTCQCQTYTVILEPHNVDNALRLIQSQVPEAMISLDVKGAPLLVSNYIREQLAGCPAVEVLKSTGFFKLHGCWLYVHDNVPSPWPHAVFATGKHIPCLPGLSPSEAFQHALRVLELSKRLDLMLPTFLLLHLGPLFELFRQAGHPPRFVTFLAGTTGSLKTSLALALLRLFQEDSDTPEATFLDTEAALEKKLGGAHGRVLLVDDFCPAVSSASGKAKLSKLELVIRFIGDQISKSRCKPNLQKAAEYAPAGCCLITGECTAGTRSSLLRCLVLPIERGDIHGERLELYQKEPRLLQSHMAYFLKWSGEHGDSVIQYIRENFNEERQRFARIVRERRLADTGAILMLMARILLQYGLYLRVFTPSDIENLTLRWSTALEAAIRTSEDCTRETEPLTMYLTAIFNLYHAGKLPLATCADSYVPTQHLGYQDGCLWWLRPDDLFKSVVQYWRTVGQIFPLRNSDVRKQLAAKKPIEITHEERNGEEKILYLRKTSTIPGRPRMLVLRADEAAQYLENSIDV